MEISVPDPQPGWADVVDAELPAQPLFADVVGRSHRGSESSDMDLDGDVHFHRYENRLGDEDKENMHPFNLLPERPCTAHFNLPSKDLPTSAVFDDLKNCGIRAAGVRCLQRTPNGFVTVTFSSADYRSLFLKKSSYIPKRFSSSRSGPSTTKSPFTFVAVYDLPYELLDSALKHRLSRYGNVRNIRRCGLQGYEGIQNGTRVVKMELRQSIPSFLRFGRRLARVKHDGQVSTCRKCHLPDHVARVCPNVVCFNCDQLGHTYRDCTEPNKCSICKEDGHYAVDCPLSWWRRPTSHRDEPAQDHPDAAPTASDDANNAADHHTTPPAGDTSHLPVPTPLVPEPGFTSHSDLSPSESSPPTSSSASSLLASALPDESQDSQPQSQSILLDPSLTTQPSSSSEPPDPGSTPVLFSTPMDSSTSAPGSQDSTTDSDLVLAAMDVTETPDDPVRTRSSSLVKRKPARVDPSQGPPARKATAPYPVSNPRKKSNNPPPS